MKINFDVVYSGAETMAGRMINGAAALAELVRPAGETDAGGLQRVLPVLSELGGLLPWRGLQRGSTVAVGLTYESPPRRVAQESYVGGTRRAREGTRAGVAWGQRAPVAEVGSNGGTSLLLALLSAASHAGSWCAVVGVPALGALAAAESGVALDRLALVPDPGPEWPTVVAALIDGVDVVVLAVPGQVSPLITSRLVARARQRGCVLVPYGRWDGADVTLQVTQGQWEGLAEGRGRLRRRRVTVVARGRGAAARPKELTFWMPAMGVLPAIPPAPGEERPGKERPGGERPGEGRPGGERPEGVERIAAVAGDSDARVRPALSVVRPA